MAPAGECRFEHASGAGVVDLGEGAMGNEAAAMWGDLLAGAGCHDEVEVGGDSMRRPIVLGCTA